MAKAEKHLTLRTRPTTLDQTKNIIKKGRRNRKMTTPTTRIQETAQCINQAIDTSDLKRSNGEDPATEKDALRNSSDTTN